MKFNLIKLMSSRKVLFNWLPIFLVVVLAILFPQISSADLGEDVTRILGWIVYAIVWVLGKILILLINLVIWVAQYNDFINAQAVTNGWKILRDLCNMFFILILLVIAFATTLNRESYAMKALLPKFIIAAILINFSKLICGVIIDFAQVIMLTFVNGFRDIGGGNLADMLGITKLLAFSNKGCGDVTMWTVMGTYILAMIYVLVATVVICVILFVLVMRMIMIWIYVVLSPMAWLLSVLPATQQYANQWWKQFAETVASGPILAFFIWLSFASVTLGTSGEQILNTPKPSASENEEEYLNQISDPSNLNNKTGENDPCKTDVQVGVAESGSSDSMIKFVISIGLLMGGLIITKQMGGVVGSIAGAGLSKIQNAAKGARNLAFKGAKGSASLAGRGALSSGKFVGRNMVGGAGLLAKKTGGKISEKTGGRFGGGLQKAGQFATDARSDWQKTVDDNKIAKKQKRLEKFGLKAQSMQSLDEWRKDSRLGKIASSVMSGSPQDLFKLRPAEKVNSMGRVIKKASFGYQRWRNKTNAAEDVENTGRLVDEKEANMSDGYKTMRKKIKGYNKSEADDLQEINQDYENDIKGKTGKEADDIAASYLKKIDDTKNSYEGLRQKAQDDYRQTTPDKDVEHDNKHLKDLESAEAYHEKAKKFNENIQATNNYKNRKADLKSEDNIYKNALDALKQEKEAAIKEAKNKFGNSSFAMQGELERINAKYDPLETRTHDEHKDRVNKIKDNYATESSMPLGGVASLMHKAGDTMSNYDPTKLTGKALEKGAKEIKEADDIAKALKSSILKEFETTNFSNAIGINSQHERTYKQLANKSEGSLDALKSLIGQLKTIQANGGPSKNSREASVINSLKKGLAHYLKKNPSDTGSFKDVIGELDKIDAHHPKGFKKVSDFAPKD